MSKDKSLLGGLFGKASKGGDGQNQAEQLAEALTLLADVYEGLDRKVDTELATFKKMVKVGTTTSDLKNQINNIRQTLVAHKSSSEAQDLARQLDEVSASTLINEFLSFDLSDEISQRLTTYQASLSVNMAASAIIPDVISILTTDLSDDGMLDAIDKATELKAIVTPLIQLFNHIELTNEQKELLEELRERAKHINDIEDLSSLLEQTSQLILSTVAGCTGQFESFLKQLKIRLDNVNKGILNTVNTNQAISENSGDFSQCINSQVLDIQSSLSEATELAQLEQLIAASLDNIMTGVSQFEDKRKQLEDEANSTIKELKHELDQAKAESNQLRDNLSHQRTRAMTDPLTNLPNRHAYNERLNLEYNRWRRYRKPLSIILGDIDFFKKINDTYGHIAGDTAIKATGSLLKELLRDTDFIARFGGEEFVILMPETNLVDATKATNKIRLSVQDNKVQEGANVINMSMSFGVACFEEDDNPKQVLERADKALYRAKAKGRNQVCAERRK